MTTRLNSSDAHAVNASLGSATECLARRMARSNGSQQRSVAPRGTIHSQTRKNRSRALKVMKFGGTSVGDASCILRVTEIVRAAARESDLVVVVSAMSSVTNKLIEAAVHAEVGNYSAAESIFQELENKHAAAAEALLGSAAKREEIGRTTSAVLQLGLDLCRAASLARALAPRVRDVILSLGERLSAPLVSAALTEHGIPSQAIEATEVIVTDSCFGGAEPCMDLTRGRAESRVIPVLRQGLVPVITGFIGATVEGELTTLGRGGSDYSATILGAALHADAVTIWTDVDGVLTSDPRLVPCACTIPEISYEEAAELAHFGAKVLHPKTLRPLMDTDIPLSIRNTFAPEKSGTMVTPEGTSNEGSVRALTAFPDATLITVGGPAMAGVPNMLARTFTATAAARADVLLILHSSSQNDVRFVIPSALAKETVETLREEFAQNLAGDAGNLITLDRAIGMITVVGPRMRRVSEIIGRTFNALNRENVNIIAMAQGSTDCNVSFVVERKDLRAALMSTHREFNLGATDAETVPAKSA
jgi:bifunctional aspartokinase / homoserine dehydrogenase 1